LENSLPDCRFQRLIVTKAFRFLQVLRRTRVHLATLATTNFNISSCGDNLCFESGLLIIQTIIIATINIDISK
jgi:hypothetical protein